LSRRQKDNAHVERKTPENLKGRLYSPHIFVSLSLYLRLMKYSISLFLCSSVSLGKVEVASHNMPPFPFSVPMPYIYPVQAPRPLFLILSPLHSAPILSHLISSSALSKSILPIEGVLKSYSVYARAQSEERSEIHLLKEYPTKSFEYQTAEHYEC